MKSLRQLEILKISNFPNKTNERRTLQPGILEVYLYDYRWAKVLIFSECIK